MRVTSKGQVTIPRDLRELAGIRPNSDVVFAIENGKLTIAAKDDTTDHRERRRLETFLRALDRLEGTGDPSLRADDVMAATRED
ncbi:MAG: AbrB/MazE/SpoVT family DNA-binding domain-containing protein [Pararhizobium sp.]